MAKRTEPYLMDLIIVRERQEGKIKGGRRKEEKKEGNENYRW